MSYVLFIIPCAIEFKLKRKIIYAKFRTKLEIERRDYKYIVKRK